MIASLKRKADYKVQTVEQPKESAWENESIALVSPE